MQETWRWFGPGDTITLRQIRQAGATGIVTSLHEIPTGEVWPLSVIQSRKAEIEAAGMNWSVVESVPLHNDIKTRTGDYLRHIANYQETLRNLGAAGIDTVCYNFMPVVDWTRTNLSYQLPNASQALRFEMTDFIAYDVFMLERENAEQDYNQEQLDVAKARFEALSPAERELLEKNIIAGLPGGEGSYDREGIRKAIAQFIALGTEGYRQHLFAFLQAVIPVAEEACVKMCIHPDDPPFSLFGLPRVVSTADDARAILEAVESPANGLTLCAGSFGARADNDLVDMVRAFGPSIFFVHLRNVKREPDGSFYESDHLDGDNDMIGLINALLDEETNRGSRNSIPMRPDHGHLMDEEMNKPGVRPGYSYAGRMKSLAELRGVIHVLERLRAAG
ncbi:MULTISPECIES: mannonate dehydratase [Marisediminitalea]|jgi:mannonate dehydratase|uniref:mannonate dehydratase n=1 Tax=Marisediminitalea TaxID=2662254 RepID=UPI000C6969F2|nr:mannonate dehydratase [Marisediminitalea aggregata]MBL54506.1 mannonate dehydratase [Alteromonadaceae bacterium]MCP3864695.1 mannonate dehydratase [Aestuariibacter sp.]MCP4238584.1 mannonate dehydratase [Aestuariibacter sp.]MCP4526935.1 mannonate dehydratase [Aestuariibacter sp.]MCP4946462.1 mannonate dehydratase [Aestuariibacter sp.]|tara:strand:- start:6460 stop:7635 length:1176 start_codon:yes stop_codon:yes gene_type:complete